MPLNTSHQLIADDRRREVAILRRRRLTVRQIVKALAEAGRVNPRTGKPWSVGIVQSDLQRLQDQARADALREVTEHKADMLADYRELLRLAWTKADHVEVRKLLADMRRLLGTDAPQVIVYEQVSQRMLAAVESLEREFAHDPATLDRALGALMGADHQGTPRPVN